MNKNEERQRLLAKRDEENRSRQELAMMAHRNHVPGTTHQLSNATYHVTATGAWRRLTPKSQSKRRARKLRQAAQRSR